MEFVKSKDLLPFFSAYLEFDAVRLDKMKNGENDYNLIESLRTINDEVNLHSCFLYSLLKPNGKHYQGNLFAKNFMEILGYADWLEWDSLKVYRERNHFDLYLTDGTRHVVIENKLNAPDQKCQIERYVNKVSLYRAVYKDILIIYLSKGRENPADESLGRLKIVPYGDGDIGHLLVTEDNTPKAIYKNCHYGKEIILWIDRCLNNVNHIPNLAFALKEYRQIIELITKKYTKKIMDLEDFLVDSAGTDRIHHAFEISKKIPSIKAKWLIKILTTDMDVFLEKYLIQEELVLIEKQDGSPFSDLQFEPGHARAFFNGLNTSKNRNKGKFWRFAAGPYKDKLALVLIYGKKMLHIGVLPIAIHNKSITIDTDSPCPKLDIKDANFNRHEAIQKLLAGLESWAIPLDEGIADMAIFKGSRQESNLEILLEKLLPPRTCPVQSISPVSASM